MNAVQEHVPRTAETVILAVFNQKGGIGKTTTTVNLAACLASLGRTVCVIDMDSQGNATSSLGLTPAPVVGIYDVIMDRTTLAAAVRPTRIPGISICAASDELSAIAIELATDLDRPEMALRQRIEDSPPVADFILVDCPPALSMLTINALGAAHGVILPVSPQSLAHDGLHKAWHHVGAIRKRLNKRLMMQGILITFAEDTPESRFQSETIRREFGSRVFASTIPHDPNVLVASAQDVPASVFDPKGGIAASYLNLAGEILDKLSSLALQSLAAMGRDPSGTTAASDPELLEEIEESEGEAEAGRRTGLPEPELSSAIGQLTKWRSEFGVSSNPSRLAPAPDLDAWTSPVLRSGADPVLAWLRYVTIFVVGLAAGYLTAAYPQIAAMLDALP